MRSDTKAKILSTFRIKNLEQRKPLSNHSEFAYPKLTPPNGSRLLFATSGQIYGSMLSPRTILCSSESLILEPQKTLKIVHANNIAGRLLSIDFYLYVARMSSKDHSCPPHHHCYRQPQKNNPRQIWALQNNVQTDAIARLRFFLVYY